MFISCPVFGFLPHCGGVCVWAIWTDVKLLLVAAFWFPVHVSFQVILQGNWGVCDWPSSTELGHRVGYLAWSARRTCNFQFTVLSEDGNRLSQEPARRFTLAHIFGWFYTVVAIWMHVYLDFIFSQNWVSNWPIQVSSLSCIGFSESGVWTGFTQTGEIARLLIFTSGKSLDSSCLFDRPIVPVSIDRQFLYNSQNWALKRPHEFEYQLLQSIPATFPFRSI